MKTREEIIETIKAKHEKAYKNLKYYEEQLGEDAGLTVVFRERWATLYLLLNDIKEPINYESLNK
jgi:hypothetical protein